MIRWARGFFRIWVLVSLVWVAVGAAIGIGSVVNPYIETRVLAVPADTNLVTLFPAWGDEHRDLRTLASQNAMVEYPIGDRGYLLYQRPEAPSATVQSRIQEAQTIVAEYVQVETSKARARQVPIVAMALLIPPFALLIAGWAIGWAIAGFRRSAV